MGFGLVWEHLPLMCHFPEDGILALCSMWVTCSSAYIHVQTEPSIQGLVHLLLCNLWAGLLEWSWGPPGTQVLGLHTDPASTVGLGHHTWARDGHWGPGP